MKRERLGDTVNAIVLIDRKVQQMCGYTLRDAWQNGDERKRQSIINGIAKSARVYREMREAIARETI